MDLKSNSKKKKGKVKKQNTLPGMDKNNLWGISANQLVVPDIEDKTKSGKCSDTRNEGSQIQPGTTQELHNSQMNKDPEKGIFELWSIFKIV